MAQVGVLLDVDGTLVDSNYHHAIAWSRALRDHGHDARLAAIHRLIGMGGDDLLQTLIGHTDPRIKASWRKHFDGLLPEVHPIPGAAQWLRELHGRGSTIVLATSAPGDLLDALRAKLDADDAIDEAVSSRDVDRAKPHPDVFEIALARAHLNRDRSVVVGDSVWDVKSAAQASLPCIGVESGGFDRVELLAAGAVAVYRDISEVVVTFATH